MIYLELLEGQGLGNQLWNYVTLRSICKTLDYGYKIINPEKFKGKTFLDISYSKSSTVRGSQNYIKENDLKYIFEEKIYFDYSLKSYVSDFDKEILKLKSNTLIKGLFQSEKYLFNNDINQFIKIKALNKKKPKAFKNKCLLNIRGGEYKRFKDLILPKSYWLNAMKNMKKTNPNIEFFIITDDYKYAEKLLPNIEIMKGKINEDFYNLYSAEYLIVSNSSFSYFPITLGEKPKKIIAPSDWSRFGNKQGKWVSPANYYENWSYQNIEGELIFTEDIEKSITNTMKIYSSYNIITTQESIYRKPIFSFIPINLRKLLKKLLSKIFPLHIG